MSYEVFLVVGGLTAIATLVAVAVTPKAIARGAAASLGAGTLLGVHALGLLRFRMDDSYVTYRYAQNLADGVGPVWNRGEHVEGYSSFLWMLLLAVAHVVGIDIEDAAILLSWAAMIALFWLLWRVWRHLSEEGGVGGVAPVLALAGVGVLVAANAGVGLWSFSGLETPLAEALVMAVILAYQRESRAPRFPLSSLVLVAAVMTRPEMAFLALVMGAFFLDQAIIEGGAQRWRHFVIFLVTFGILAGIWQAWRWSYYGYPFPNTYYDKVGPLDLMVLRGWAYLGIYWWSFLLAPALIAGVLLPFFLRGRPQRDAAFICAVNVTWMVAVITEGGDGFFQGRFLVPVVPSLYLALVAGITIVLARVPMRRAQNAAALMIVIIACAFVVVRGSNQDDVLELNRRALNDWRVEGEWVRANVPPDYVTGVFAAGTEPYFSQRPSLDLLGLTDETIAHTKIRGFGRGIPGHEKYNIDYVLDERRPEIIFFGSPSPNPLTEDEIKTITGEENGIVPATVQLITDKRTWERYEMAAFFRSGIWYPLLVRRDVENLIHADWIESKGQLRQGGLALP